MSKMPGPKHLLPSRRHFELFQGADGVNGVEMPRDQNPGLALSRMRKVRADAAGKTLPARDALDRRTHDRHVARGDVEHAVHGARVPGRTFAFHPAAQSLQHGFGVKGKVGGVHLNFPGLERDAGAMRNAAARALRK